MFQFDNKPIPEKEYIRLRRKQVVEMEFDQLFLETVGLHGGDDYEGQFTAIGWADFQILSSELMKRMNKKGMFEHPVKTKRRLIQRL